MSRRPGPGFYSRGVLLILVVLWSAGADAGWVCGVDGVDAVTGPTGGKWAPPVEAPRCPEGFYERAIEGMGISTCVPDGYKQYQNGSEWTLSDDSDNKIVFSLQVKVISEEKIYKPLEDYLSQKHVPAFPVRGEQKAWKESNGHRTTWWRAWAKQVHRWGVLVYVRCTGDEQYCGQVQKKAHVGFMYMRVVDEVGSTPMGSWQVLHKAPLRLHAVAGTAAAGDLEWLEQEYRKGYEAITNITGCDESPGVDVYFYPNKTELWRYTRRDSGFAITETNEVHSLFASRTDRQSTGHEMVHVIVSGIWGEAGTALLGEGLAVALDQSGRDQHAAAREALGSAAGGYWLGELSGDGFFKVDPAVAYAVSGSFVRFLLDTYGSDVLHRLYTMPFIENAIPEVTGKGFVQVAEEWKAAAGMK